MSPDLRRAMLYAVALLVPPTTQYALLALFFDHGNISPALERLIGIHAWVAAFCGAGLIGYLTQQIVLVIVYFAAMMALLMAIGITIAGPVRGYP